VAQGELAIASPLACFVDSEAEAVLAVGAAAVSTKNLWTIDAASHWKRRIASSDVIHGREPGALTAANAGIKSCISSDGGMLQEAAAEGCASNIGAETCPILWHPLLGVKSEKSSPNLRGSGLPPAIATAAAAAARELEVSGCLGTRRKTAAIPAQSMQPKHRTK
jgi:hypothetical protein